MPAITVLHGDDILEQEQRRQHQQQQQHSPSLLFNGFASFQRMSGLKVVWMQMWPKNMLSSFI